MTRIVAACIAVLAAALMLSTRSVETFYDDTHYSFTYYMARECGYTPLQALRLASADVRIDYSSPTEPVQGLNTLATVVAAITPGGTFASRGFSAAAQKPRVDFHAMMDAGFRRGQQGPANAAIEARERELWVMAKETRNPGVLLHFIQDRPSHAGYASTGGHWLSAAAGSEVGLRLAETAVRQGIGAAPDNVASLSVLDTLEDLTLPMGATTDFLSYRPDRTNLMIAATLKALTRFMIEMSPRGQRPRQGLRDYCAEPAIRSVKEAVARANASRIAKTAAQYKDQVLALLQKKIPATAEALEKLRRLHGVNEATPNMRPANDVVENALRASGELTRYTREPIPYEFRPTGDPLGSLDAFTLYGTVNVRLNQPGSTTGPVAVSVWSAPTRKGEQSYQLACESATPSTVVSGPITPDASFDNIPVGDLVVQAVSPGGSITRKLVSFDSLLRLEQLFTIDLAEETEETKRCDQKAAEVARQLCKPASNVNASLNIRQLEQLETRYLDEALAAQSCRQAAPQTSQTTPKKGGASWPVAIAAGGGVLGGLIALDKLRQTTTTTSIRTTTTTTSIRPTTTTTSVGSTTTTRATTTTTTTGSLRCSTRNCLYDAFGRCECLGSVNATCPVSDPQRIQRTVGGACFNNGLYCDVNLSCTNNRCERDVSQGGRCRF